MEELVSAIVITKKYDRMSIESFIKELEIYKGIKIPETIIETWRFTGLSNSDLIIAIDSVMEIYNEKVKDK